MMKLFKKSAVTLASIALLSVGAVNTAQADSYAYANLDIVNLTMSDSGGNVLVLGTDVSVPNGVNNGQINNAAFLGSPAVQTNDSSMACLGDCGAIAENDFSAQAPGLHFVRTDSDINGSIIDVGFGAGGVTAQSVAETHLTKNQISNGSSTVSTNTEFDFLLGKDTAVQFDFTTVGTLFASQTVDNNVPPSFAQAASSFSIVITEVLTGNTIFNWSPDGFLGDNATVSEISDNLTNSNNGLTQNRAATSAGQTITEDLAGTFSAISKAVLLAGVDYTLSINHQTNVLAARDVPEPGMLFLLGLGLAGFAVSKRKSA